MIMTLMAFPEKCQFIQDNGVIYVHTPKCWGPKGSLQALVIKGLLAAIGQ